MAKEGRCSCFKICAKPECFFVIFPLSILCLFLMAGRHTKTSDNVPHLLQLSESGEENDYAKQRSEIYEKMSRDLCKQGARFLSGRQTSQSLSLSEPFDIKNGVVVPVLKVIDRTDPAIIRRKLQHVLPQVTNKSEDVIIFIDHLVSQLDKKLQGYKALISEVGFVEEYDVLALALNGRIKAHKFSLDCLTD